MSEAFLSPAPKAANIVKAYHRLGYRFYDCYTACGHRIGIVASSFENAKRHADRMSRHGRMSIVRMREVPPPLDAFTE